MKPSDAKLAERKPVWNALSELFLDTELQTADLDRIAAVLAQSSYSEKKIEEILKYEITPVLKSNMTAVAGEWVGFDEDWLQKKLATQIDRKPIFSFGVFYIIRKDWLDIKSRIQNLRK